MGKVHQVGSIRTSATYLYLTVDGQSYRVRWADCSPRLAKATMAQRKRFEISPSGYGIHWPEIDEDLAVTLLLQRAKALVPTGAATVGPSPRTKAHARPEAQPATVEMAREAREDYYVERATDLSSAPIDLRVRGMDEAQAADLRARLVTFVEDWDSPEMDVYDDYDAAKARL